MKPVNNLSVLASILVYLGLYNIVEDPVIPVYSHVDVMLASYDDFNSRRQYD